MPVCSPVHVRIITLNPDPNSPLFEQGRKHWENLRKFNATVNVKSGGGGGVRARGGDLTIFFSP